MRVRMCLGAVNQVPPQARQGFIVLLISLQANKTPGRSKAMNKFVMHLLFNALARFGGKYVHDSGFFSKNIVSSGATWRWSPS